jgi:hypothetical protein
MDQPEIVHRWACVWRPMEKANVPRLPFDRCPVGRCNDHWRWSLRAHHEQDCSDEEQSESPLARSIKRRIEVAQ